MLARNLNISKHFPEKRIRKIKRLYSEIAEDKAIENKHALVIYVRVCNCVYFIKNLGPQMVSCTQVPFYKEGWLWG